MNLYKSIACSTPSVKPFFKIDDTFSERFRKNRASANNAKAHFVSACKIHFYSNRTAGIPNPLADPQKQSLVQYQPLHHRLLDHRYSRMGIHTDLLLPYSIRLPLD